MTFAGCNDLLTALWHYLQISSDSVTYFVHSMEQGLIAAFEMNTQWYYQFNGDK